MSRLLPSLPEVAQEAVEVLRRGGVILYPTETIWGIGCDATNPQGVRRLISIKQRPPGKAMLMLVDSDIRIPSYVRTIPSIAYDLIDVAVSPLTIIYPNGRNVCPELLSEDGSIGIRITSHPLCQEICRRLRTPLVSTSANLSGEPSPSCFDDISSQLLEAVDYIVPIEHEVPLHTAKSSEIIKLGIDNEVEIIR